MLRSAGFIARKDVAYALRGTETRLWTFVMPILFFWFIGTVTGSAGGQGGVKDHIVVLAPDSAGPLADEVIRRLEAEDFEVVVVNTAAEFEERSGWRRRLVLPADFSASVAEGVPVELILKRRGTGVGADYDELRVSLATYRLLADLIVLDSQGIDATPEAMAALGETDRPLRLAVRPAGKAKQIPMGFDQAVPGTMVMFTMMLLLTSGAVHLMIERKLGLLRRMASAPLSRGTVVLGKWGGKMGLAVVQVTFAMITGVLLFDVEWGTGWSLVAVITVIMAWASFCASLGLLLGSWADTEGQAVGIGVVGTMVLAALGGCWWPIEVTPAWMQQLAHFTPTGWTMDALHRLLSFRDAPVAVLPHIGALFSGALVVGLLAVRRFRFD